MQIAKIQILIFSILILGISKLLSQETKVYVGLGGIYNSFQDTRFSDVQYSKLSFLPELGFTRVSEKNYFHANGSFFAYTVKFPFIDTIQTTLVSYNLRIGYLRAIKPKLFVGINWDVLDFYKRTTNFLGNNSDTYKLSSDICLSGKYNHKLTESFNIDFGLDLGFLTFVNTDPSFTANYQQNLVDKGEITFLEEETRSPYKISNMDARFFWKQFNLRSQIELSFRRRWSINYTWDLRRFSDYKGYPVTDARHKFTLRFHFINHLKKNKNETTN